MRKVYSTTSVVEMKRITKVFKKRGYRDVLDVQYTQSQDGTFNIYMDEKIYQEHLEAKHQKKLLQ